MEQASSTKECMCSSALLSQMLFLEEVVRGPTTARCCTLVFHGTDSSQVELAKPKVEPANDHLYATCEINTFPRLPSGPQFVLAPPK
jgi:hypothetical protein